MHWSDWLHCVSALQSLGLHWSAYHLIHPMSSKTCIFFQICVPLCLGSAAILLYNLPQKMWRKKCDLLISFFHELPGNMCHLKYPLNGAGCFCRGCLTGWTGSPATWLPGWWPRWPPGCQGGDQGRRTAAQGGHVTHGERGVLYPGRLDHHLFVLHHHQPWPSPCQSRWTLQWRVFILTTWHSIALRREFADLNPTILLEGIICGASTTIEGRSKLPRF